MLSEGANTCQDKFGLWTTDCPLLTLGVWHSNSGAWVPASAPTLYPMHLLLLACRAVSHSHIGSIPVSGQQSSKGSLVWELQRPSQCQQTLPIYVLTCLSVVFSPLRDLSIRDHGLEYSPKQKPVQRCNLALYSSQNLLDSPVLCTQWTFFYYLRMNIVW